MKVREKVREVARKGRLTIYSKWVIDDGGADTGDEVIVETRDGQSIGVGVYDGIGPVAIRLLSIDRILPLSEILRINILKAYNYRKRLGWRSYRLINSDGDNMPGIIIDVYNDIAVIQSGSGGLDQYLDYIASILAKEKIADKIYVKNVQRSRREAGLETWSGWIYGKGDPRTIIKEGNARFIVDIENGQKTGFFLDQRMNRLEIRLYSRDAVILDLFSYTGGFGIHSLLEGGKKAIFVEEDERAVELLQENIKLNNLEDKAEVYHMRVEKFFQENNLKYDLVISDPPAFIQSKDKILSGLSKYREILRNILRVLSIDSIIFYSSCSYFLKPKDFTMIIDDELGRHKCRHVYLGRLRGASPDHVNSGEDELNYLKAAFLRIVS